MPTVDAGWSGSSFGFDGGYGISSDTILGTSPWHVGRRAPHEGHLLHGKPDSRHSGRYYRGTNNKNMPANAGMTTFHASYPDATGSMVGSTYLTTKDGAEVTFTHVPEKVIAANGNAGDQLMALGLGDKIIATAYTNSDINPKWDAEYKAIPEAAETYISLETVLSLEPDFVYGRSSSFTEKYNTEHDTLTKYGIMSLSSIEATPWGPMWTWCTRLLQPGRIFQVEDKAEEIVSGMKARSPPPRRRWRARRPPRCSSLTWPRRRGLYLRQQLHLQAHRARGRRQHLQRSGHHLGHRELGDGGGAGPRGDRHQRLRRHDPGGEDRPAQGEPCPGHGARHSERPHYLRQAVRGVCQFPMTGDSGGEVRPGPSTQTASRKRAV